MPDNYLGEGIGKELDVCFHPSDKILDALAAHAIEADRPLAPLGLLVVNESQFMTPKQVEELAVIAHINDIEVSAYGLLNNFMGKLSPASAALVAWADKIEEKKHVAAWRISVATLQIRMHV